MKTFKQWLMEKWSTDKMESKIRGKKQFASHQAHIDGHHVRVDFSGSEDPENKGHYHYTANYTVDHDYERSHALKHATGQKILHHVNKRINQFVRHVKPKSLTMGSKKENRIALHHHMSKRLAKQHGGHVEKREGAELTYHTVHFERKKGK